TVELRRSLTEHYLAIADAVPVLTLSYASGFDALDRALDLAMDVTGGLLGAAAAARSCDGGVWRAAARQSRVHGAMTIRSWWLAGRMLAWASALRVLKRLPLPRLASLVAPPGAG